MLESELEVGDVLLELHLEDLAGGEVGEEEDLLGGGEDEGAEHGDVGLDGIPRDREEIAGELHPDDAPLVLLLHHAPVALVVRALVGAEGVRQGVLGAATLRGLVGEEDGGGAEAEEAVGDEHRLVFAAVPVERHALRAHH